MGSGEFCPRDALTCQYHAYRESTRKNPAPAAAAAAAAANSGYSTEEDSAPSSDTASSSDEEEDEPQDEDESEAQDQLSELAANLSLNKKHNRGVRTHDRSRSLPVTPLFDVGTSRSIRVPSASIPVRSDVRLKPIVSVRWLSDTKRARSAVQLAALRKKLHLSEKDAKWFYQRTIETDRSKHTGSDGCVVYPKIRDRENQEVAVKIIHAQLADEKEMKEAHARFEREVEALLLLRVRAGEKDSEYISVAMHGFHAAFVPKSSSEAFFIMILDCFQESYLDVCKRLPLWAPAKDENDGVDEDGKPLALDDLRSSEVTKRKRMRIEHMWQLVECISKLHEHGLFHGDLYSRNVMLSQAGRAGWLFLIDFGNAGRADEEQWAHEWVSHPDERPPEIENLNGRRTQENTVEIDFLAGEMYSLAATVMHVVTECKASADDPLQRARFCAALSSKGGSQDEAETLYNIFLRCLHSNPSTRPTAGELWTACDDYKQAHW